jgi:uncharacterized protein YbbC (DUF1343 family)
MILGMEAFIQKGLYKKSRIGLLTNQTGITSQGIPNWKALLENGYRLTSIFGPEHGFLGEAQDVIPVEDGLFLGIPVYSLFGSRTSPTEEMLQDIDVIVVDIQDIGCRYYTYIYSLACMMQLCERTGTPVVVTDRPNPLGGFEVCGNCMTEQFASFVGGYGLPNLHGLTLGEFANYLATFYFLNINLDIVPLQGYDRSRSLGDLPLPWVSPSPNMPSLETTYVYPGTCLFEGTNISEGRGTTRPFEIIGAPWIEGEKLREYLKGYQLPGVVFTSQYFTPVFSKYQGESCQGVCLHVTDTSSFLPLQTGLALLHAIHAHYPEQFQWKEDWESEGHFFIEKLLGSIVVLELFNASAPFSQILKGLLEENGEYLEKRAKILLYPDVRM